MQINSRLNFNPGLALISLLNNPSLGYRIEINQKSDSVGTFEVDVLTHIGPYKYKTSAFVTGKCRLKVKSAGGTSQDGIKMAYFGHAH